MATVTGQDGQVSVAGAAVSNVTSWSIDMTADTVDATVMGSSHRTFKSGISSFSGSFDVLVDETLDGSATGTMYGMDGNASVQGDALAFIFTTSTGGKTYSGNGIITGKSVSAEMEGMISMSVTFQGTGDLAETPGT